MFGKNAALTIVSPVLIALEPHPEGLVVQVRALPGAQRNEIRGEQEGALRVAVTQIAEKGKANKALRDVVARGLNLRKSQVELVAGHTSSHKRFLVRDVAAAELLKKIAQACLPG